MQQSCGLVPYCDLRRRLAAILQACKGTSSGHAREHSQAGLVSEQGRAGLAWDGTHLFLRGFGPSQPNTGAWHMVVPRHQARSFFLSFFFPSFLYCSSRRSCTGASACSVCPKHRARSFRPVLHRVLPMPCAIAQSRRDLAQGTKEQTFLPCTQVTWIAACGIPKRTLFAT